jgi:hypothetical protein
MSWFFCNRMLNDVMGNYSWLQGRFDVWSQHVLPELHAFLEEIALHAQVCINIKVHMVSLGGWVPLHIQQTVPL